MEPSDKIIADLQRIILMQAKEIAKIPLLIARIEVLERELARNKTKKDSNNSSLPPSKDENRPPRTSSLREKGCRKTGAPPGHNGKTLEMTNNPDEIVEHRACFCPECGKDISSQPFEYYGKRQVIDIPVIKQIVTEHRVYKCTCICGRDVESDFPVDVDSPVKYGKGVESLIGYLSVRQYLPFKRLQEMLNDIFAVQISEGGLHCLLKRLASKGVDAYEMIRQNELECLLKESLDPKHKEMVSFQKRIIKYRDHIFTFLYHPDVPPDNNGSERAIRNVKVKQKISGQFKILNAAENFAILRSIIDTAIKNNQNVVGALGIIAAYKRN